SAVYVPSSLFVASNVTLFSSSPLSHTSNFTSASFSASPPYVTSAKNSTVSPASTVSGSINCTSKSANSSLSWFACSFSLLHANKSIAVKRNKSNNRFFIYIAPYCNKFFLFKDARSSIISSKLSAFTPSYPFTILPSGSTKKNLVSCITSSELFFGSFNNARNDLIDNSLIVLKSYPVKNVHVSKSLPYSFPYTSNTSGVS